MCSASVVGAFRCQRQVAWAEPFCQQSYFMVLGESEVDLSGGEGCEAAEWIG